MSLATPKIIYRNYSGF